MQATTLKSIAEELKITPQAVSMALRGYPNISKARIEQVRKLAKLREYRPNVHARSLVRGRTDHVALITRPLAGPFFGELVDRFVRTFSEFNFRVSVDVADVTEEATLSAVRDFGGEMVDAVFICPSHPSMSFERIKGSVRCPIIGLVHKPSDPRVPYVAFDLRDAAREGTRHLLRLGRQRIGYVGGVDEADGRFEGYREALREAGMTSDPSWVVRDDCFLIERAQEAGKKLAGLSRPPDALFVASDSLAMGVISGLGQKGVRVPGEVAVVSHNGDTMGAYYRPALTTMALPLPLMANRCLAMLQAIHGGKTKKEILEMSCELPAKLVVRESCGQKVNPSGARELGAIPKEAEPAFGHQR